MPDSTPFMRKLLTITFTIAVCLGFDRTALALAISAPRRKSVYTDASGKKQSAQVVDKYYPKKIVQPLAKSDTNIDHKFSGGHHCRVTRSRPRFPSARIL